MTQKFIDLRSDTVTRPTPAMRAAMANAAVGDDVLGDDPTVLKLQERLADLLGKEAALFVPSGTMSNQIGLRLHCGPGDEFLCEAGCHIFNYEQAGYAQLSAVAAQPIGGDGGVLDVHHLEGRIRADNDHLAQTRLLCIENTHNRAAGRIQPFDTVTAACRWARTNGLNTHLDGARLFNAVVATGISARHWANNFDTVSVCFSKGLGAPVGSALAGPTDMIRRAKRIRKLFGGGMRQAGVVAAGALYALEHHIDRLADDHARARVLAAGIAEIDGLSLSSTTVDTNIVIFDVTPRLGTAAQWVAELHQGGVLVLATGQQSIRVVTHMDVDQEAITRALEMLAALAQDRSFMKSTENPTLY